MNAAFGRRLRQVRMENQLLQSSFAESCGISPAYLSDIERGKRQPPRDPVILQWAALLDPGNAEELGAELIGLAAQDQGRAEAVIETETEASGVQWVGGKAPKKASKEGSSTPFIDYFCQDWVQQAHQGVLDPAPGYHPVYREIAAVLARRTRPHALVRAANGGEIRRVLAGLAWAIAHGEMDGALEGVHLFCLSGIQAGVKYRGQFEERLNTLLDELATVKNGVLLCSQVGDLIDFDEGAKGSFFRPALELGRIRVLAAATPGDWAQAQKRNADLLATFQLVEVKPLGREEILQGLHAVKDRFEEHHGVIYTPEGLVALVDAAEDGGEEHFNQRAYDLMDEIGALTAIEKGDKVGVAEVDSCLEKE